MKKINYLIKTMFVFGVLMLGSCNKLTELDLVDNPNALSPNQASPDFFLNAIQEDFARIVEQFGRTGAEVTRIDYMSGRNYTNAYSAASFNTEWLNAYQDMMSDIHTMNDLSVESGRTHHIGMGQVFEAYTLMTLVDFFGDVPYSEALLGAANLNPHVDAGGDVYAAAIGLLDAAIINFGTDAIGEPQYDFFYDGNWNNWIKAANTLKMKAYMTTRLVDASALAKFDAIVASGDYIANTSEDFQFTWGTNEIQPDTRHPRYSGSYTATGGEDYMSNSLMDYMTGKDPGAYLAPWNFDVRTLFYFYRQVSSTPGQGGAPGNEETLECSLYTAPAHYDGYTFCGVAKGWWGRDHGNENGIPPDGFTRTLAGVYPAAGKLDDWSYKSQKNGGGFGGNGITPVMLASWTKFMIAETQMLAGNEAGAKASIFEGIDISYDKVVNFKPLSDRMNLIFDGVDNYPTLDQYHSFFVSDLGADWDAGTTTDKWNILAMQYFVASYGNGIDAYDFYRRTGYPTTLQPNIEPAPGGFIRSFFYPANFANTNSSITQKVDVDVKVFWDTNPASPGFPIAN